MWGVPSSLHSQKPLKRATIHSRRVPLDIDFAVFPDETSAQRTPHDMFLSRVRPEAEQCRSMTFRTEGPGLTSMTTIGDVIDHLQNISLPNVTKLTLASHVYTSFARVMWNPARLAPPLPTRRLCSMDPSHRPLHAVLGLLDFYFPFPIKYPGHPRGISTAPRVAAAAKPPYKN